MKLYIPRLPRAPDNEITRMKKRLARLGKKNSPETREKMRLARLGKPRKPETIAKMIETKRKKREEREKDPVFAAKMRKKTRTKAEVRRVTLINMELKRRAEEAWVAKKDAESPGWREKAARLQAEAALLKTKGKREDNR